MFCWTKQVVSISVKHAESNGVCLVSKWEQPLVVAHVQIVYMMIHVFPLCTHKGCIFVPVHLVRCYTTPCGSRVLQNTPANTPHFYCACTSVIVVDYQ